MPITRRLHQSDKKMWLKFGRWLKRMSFSYVFLDVLLYAIRTTHPVFLIENVRFWSHEPMRFGIGERKVTFVVESRPFKFVLRGKASANNITAFCANVTAGHVHPFWRSQPLPSEEEHSRGPVQAIVAENFEAVVTNLTRRVRIFILLQGR